MRGAAELPPACPCLPLPALGGSHPCVRSRSRSPHTAPADRPLAPHQPPPPPRPLPCPARCRSLAAVVSVISCGLLLLVYGETQFHLAGFLLVMTAAMLAGLRWTITQVLLQGEGGGAHGERAGT